MPKARNLLRQNTFDPDAVKKMGEVYDHVWTSVEQAYEGRPAAEAELARTALAKAILHFAGMGHTDPNALKSMALRVAETPSQTAERELISPPT